MSWWKALLNSSASFVLVMLAIPLGLTFYAWYLTDKNVHEVQTAKFETLAQESEKSLIYRMNSYRQALLGGAGFYQGSNHIDRKEWKSYVRSVDVLNNFPGINGIGTIYDVPEAELEAYIAEAQADFYPNFKPHPGGKHRAYYIITFIEPVSINVEAVGLNIAFEQNRYEAANLARDSGDSAITKRILLVQDAEKTPGFLLLHPMYKRGMPIFTPAQRRAAFERWIYAPFIAKNFMRDLTDSQGRTFHLQVYDGTEVNPDAVIYDSSNGKANADEATFKIVKEIEIMQQKWLLVWSSTDDFEALENSNEPFLVLLAGLIFTAMLALFMMLILHREVYKSNKLPLRSYLLPLVAFLLTMLGIYYLNNEVKQREQRLVANLTTEAAKNIHEGIYQEINSQVKAIQRMASRWAVRNGTPYEEWVEDANAYLTDQPSLRTIEWVDNTYHVRWVLPVEGNEQAIGLNIVFDEKRKKALEGAAQKDGPTITPPLNLVQGYTGIIAYAPIHTDEGFQGFIVGIFSLDQLLEAIMPEGYYDDYILNISHDGNVFYDSTHSNQKPRSANWADERTLKLFDTVWQLRIQPTQQFSQRNSTVLGELIMIIGTLLALLIAAILHFSQRTRLQSQQIAEQENLLATFVQYTPAAVAMFDKDIYYMAASEPWYRDYDLIGQDIIGRSHYEIFPEIVQNHPEWLDIHQRTLRGEVIKADEDLFVRDDGHHEWLRYELRPWYKANKEVGGLIMFTENITERKRIELMKNEFIATVNHELRTPLTSIQGSLGLLQAKAIDVLDDKGNRLLELAYDNCIRLTHLVNDILDIEKIAAGKMQFDLKPTEMNQVVSTTVEQNISYAQKYDVSFEVKLLETEVFCKVDENRFVQALTNLLSNAAKFSPHGGTVNVSLKMLSDKRVEIIVQDYGEGVPEDFHDKIFEKFAQADSSSTRTKGGTGLGLNITRSIIEAFNGQVLFDSKPGEGATFYFTLPTCPAPKENKNAK